MTMDSLQTEVRGVFAEVTRYPLEILDPQANLEEDLGIDSVKLGEVFSVLREKFRLPQNLGIARESLTTIDGVSRALAQYVASNGKSSNGNGVASTVLKNGNGAAPRLVNGNGAVQATYTNGIAAPPAVA